MIERQYARIRSRYKIGCILCWLGKFSLGVLYD